MRTKQYVAAVAVAITMAGTSYAASGPIPGTTQMVVTVRPGADGNRPDKLVPGDLIVTQDKSSTPVVSVDRLTGPLAGMQLFFLLDDSTRAASLGTQLPDLKRAIEALPANTQVGVGYMRNGSVSMAQTFTADHAAAAKSLRLPQSSPGANGSPYFALSDLVKHWPSKEPTERRAVVMLTDGVDRYFGGPIVDDPYVDASIHDALKQGVMVYSIYLRGAGLYGTGSWTANIAQSRLSEVSDQTGGHSYYLDFTDPVNITPYLKDLEDRLNNQYRVVIQASNDKGVQPVKVHTELPQLKVEAPTRVYVR